MRLLSHRDPETGARSFAAIVGERAITAAELRDAGGLDHTDALLDTYWLLDSDRWKERVDEALAKALQHGAEGRPLLEFTPAAAIQTPEKVICVGLNYRDHTDEQRIDPPTRPLLFSKFANAVVADGEPVIHPAGSHALDLEGELGVVIGRRARRVAAADAMDHVAGYVVCNDVSARDWQGTKPALRDDEVGDGQWLRAKGSDTFLPMSAVLVTADEVPDPHDLRIHTILRPGGGADPAGDVEMQNGWTGDMIFRIPALIEFISAVITLVPGDIISTGTPSGVGVFRDPPVFLQPGDRMQVFIEGIGGVTNPIVAEEATGI
jgi:2-keto-4-pentenoate hydratase/2-oxohepta-3-ene-1,7-dioic acid hydratase in catechol pathway